MNKCWIIFVSVLLMSIVMVSASTVFTFTSSGSWTAPCVSGSENVTVSLWGAGAGGGGRNGSVSGQYGAGGGGGSYALQNLTVTCGSSYAVTVGLGGAGGSATGGQNGSAGGDSWFLDNTTALAVGGLGGQGGRGTPFAVAGLGGNASLNVGSIVFFGGRGSNATSTASGSGGGGAGSTGVGNNASSTTGGSAKALNGGAGGAGSSASGGSAGSVSGGGGAGGRSSGASGLAGARGLVVVTYLCVENWSQESHPSCDGILPSYNISYTDQSICGTTTDLPVDNGTIFTCCVESWVQDSPPLCDGLLKNYSISFHDTFVCNTTASLPVNNGSTFVCPTFSGLGDGSIGNPYQITSCSQLQEMNIGLAGNYVLMDDVDCSDTHNWNSGLGFVPIGNSSNVNLSFRGNFVGDYHLITNLFINRTSSSLVGLFGSVRGGNVSRVGLDGVSISGGANTGGLIGLGNCVNVSDSFVIGNVAGSSNAGGLIGSLSSSDCNSVVSNSFVQGNVLGNAGFVGLNNGSVSTSYSTANVLSGSSGFAPNGVCSWSYWDIETSGKISSGCGAFPLANASMMISSSFFSWDFVSTWEILSCINSGFPYLRGFGGCPPVIEVGRISTTPYVPAVGGGISSGGAGSREIPVSNVSVPQSVLPSVAQPTAVSPSANVLVRLWDKFWSWLVGLF